MGKVWAAAVAGDPSPDLATHGKTGTVGAGSRSLSTGDPYLEGTDALPAFRRIVRQEQLFPVIWTIDTQDYLMAGNPQDIVRGVVRQDSAGRKQNRDQIVLMHDIHPQDAQALPGIIDHFEHSDRKFVSVNELLTNKYLEP
jgi:peptidoglycan/xylan/chitin deacetylase (PgdA/CDA1 family)